MIEQTISVTKALTYLAWAWALALLMTAPIVGFTSGRWWLALLFAEAACVTSAVAATLTVRCYASKLAALICATATAPATAPAEPSRVHSLR